MGDGLQLQIDGSIQILIYSLFCLKHWKNPCIDAVQCSQV
jgi:hypothetical protein